MEKTNQKVAVKENSEISRKRSLFLPVFGLLILVFTISVVSAFFFTWSTVNDLGVKDAQLKEQINQLRVKILALKGNIADGNLDRDGLDQVPQKEINQEGQSRKRQIQAFGFMSAILKAQEKVFERYCVDHNTTCPKGHDGIKGVPGDNGTDGVVNGTVTQGNIGPPGPQGDQGDAGNPGVKGPDGDKGGVGDVGTKGPVGAPGIQGTDGENGTNGVDGDLGNKGLQGSPGLKGESGDSGLPGLDGNIGITGDKGANGTTGPPGPQGEAGLQGPKGAASRLWDDPSCSCLSKTTRSVFRSLIL